MAVLGNVKLATDVAIFAPIPVTDNGTTADGFSVAFEVRVTVPLYVPGAGGFPVTFKVHVAPAAKTDGPIGQLWETVKLADGVIPLTSMLAVPLFVTIIDLVAPAGIKALPKSAKAVLKYRPDPLLVPVTGILVVAPIAATNLILNVSAIAPTL